MKSKIIAVAAALAIAGGGVYIATKGTKLLTPKTLSPPPPYSTNWPPKFNPPFIDTNQLWLSISQNDTTITITVNKMNPNHSYYMWATHSYTPTNWLLVTPFGPASTYSLAFPKSSLFTNGAPMLFFRTQDVTP